MTSISITVIPDPDRGPSDLPSWLAIVTSRRRRFVASWGDDRPPTEAMVRDAWREERRAFRPYREWNLQEAERVREIRKYSVLPG